MENALLNFSYCSFIVSARYTYTGVPNSLAMLNSCSCDNDCGIVGEDIKGTDDFRASNLFLIPVKERNYSGSSLSSPSISSPHSVTDNNVSSSASDEAVSV